MRDLAREVQLSKPALYHYVASKEALLVEIYEGVTVGAVESARRMLERTDVTHVEAIRELLVERTAYTCENRRLLQIFFEEESEIPVDLMRTMRKQRRAYEDSLIELLDRGARDGSLSFDTTPRIVVNALLGAAHWTYKWYDPKAAKSARELAEELVDVLLLGLMTRESARHKRT
jgi:AcrR family transcriptional regulator